MVLQLMWKWKRTRACTWTQTSLGTIVEETKKSDLSHEHEALGSLTGDWWLVTSWVKINLKLKMNLNMNINMNMNMNMNLTLNLNMYVHIDRSNSGHSSVEVLLFQYVCPQFLLLGKFNIALFAFIFMFHHIGRDTFEAVKEEQFWSLGCFRKKTLFSRKSKVQPTTH